MQNLAYKYALCRVLATYVITYNCYIYGDILYLTTPPTISTLVLILYIQHPPEPEVPATRTMASAATPQALQPGVPNNT